MPHDLAVDAQLRGDWTGFVKVVCDGVGDDLFDEEDSIDVVDSKFAVRERDCSVVDEGLEVARARVVASSFVEDAGEKRGVVFPSEWVSTYVERDDGGGVLVCGGAFRSLFVSG